MLAALATLFTAAAMRRRAYSRHCSEVFFMRTAPTSVGRGYPVEPSRDNGAVAGQRVSPASHGRQISRTFGPRDSLYRKRRPLSPLILAKSSMIRVRTYGTDTVFDACLTFGRPGMEPDAPGQQGSANFVPCEKRTTITNVVGQKDRRRSECSRSI